MVQVEQIQSFVETFFDKMQIIIDAIEILQEWDNIFKIKLSTPDSSILIWYSWGNLSDLRKVLKMMMSNLFQENLIIHIEVNDYIEQKDQKLFNVIKSKLALLDREAKEIALPLYNAYERKKIHSFISDLKRTDIQTQSRGEWKDRRMYILKKQSKLTIDIDWLDI